MARNPLHDLIETLGEFDDAVGKCHDASTEEQKKHAKDAWLKRKDWFWPQFRIPSEAVRGLADPALEWCSNRGLEIEIYEPAIETAAFLITELAKLTVPYALPDTYADKSAAEKAWKAEGELLSQAWRARDQLRKLAAMAGIAWRPTGQGRPGYHDEATSPDSHVSEPTESRNYDPFAEQPKTFGELVKWASYAAAFNHDKDNQNCPVVLNGEYVLFIEAYIKDKFQPQVLADMKPLGSIRARYMRITRKTDPEIDGTSLRDLVTFLQSDDADAEHTRRIAGESIPSGAQGDSGVETHADGPVPAHWLWWGGKRHRIGRGRATLSWKLLAFFWNRDVADYEELTGQGMPWPDPVDDSAIATAVNRFNNEVPRDLPWRLATKERRVFKKFPENPVT